MPKRKLRNHEHSVEQAANIPKPFEKAVSLTIYLVDALDWFEVQARKLVKPVRVCYEIVIHVAEELLLLLDLEKRTNI